MCVPRDPITVEFMTVGIPSIAAMNVAAMAAAMLNQTTPEVAAAPVSSQGETYIQGFTPGRNHEEIADPYSARPYRAIVGERAS